MCECLVPCSICIKLYHQNLIYFFYLQNITDAMKTVCEILTADPDGGPARIPYQLFKDLYKYLATIDGEISQEHMDEVLTHLQYDVYVSICLYLLYTLLHSGLNKSHWLLNWPSIDACAQSAQES